MFKNMAMHDSAAFVGRFRCQVEPDRAVSGHHVIILTILEIAAITLHLHMVDMQVKWVVGRALQFEFLYAVRFQREVGYSMIPFAASHGTRAHIDGVLMI